MNAPKSSPRETFWLTLKSGRSAILSALVFWIERTERVAQRWYAMQWQRIYGAHYRLTLWKARYKVAVTIGFLITLTIFSGYLAPALQDVLEPYFSSDERLSGLNTLLVTLGGSLIGAAAIAFSLVMFAMQVNVERMPHGLFRKFSSDPKLLGAFAATFLVAIAVATTSLVPDRSWLAVAALIASWGTVLILVLFVYAYRRALRLVSPTEQLALVVADARRDLQMWVRRARRAAPLLERPGHEKVGQESPLRSDHDLPRVTYFQLNPHWTAVSQRAIVYSVSFARRYAEYGDHEVARVALNAVVAINAAYVEAKGKTFFANVLMFDNPLARDGFINDTLEHLRQNVQIGISRGDEQQIEQTFRAMSALCRVFLSIDYASEHTSKTHAHLAAAYLSGAVESVIPHNMPDVLMEGVRLLGEVAQQVLHQARPEDIATITEKIALISCSGAAKESYRPVTLIGIEQLARLAFELIRSNAHDIRFAAKEIRGDVRLVAKDFLTLPDTPLASIHSAHLAPYYSGTSTEALQAWLTELVNVVMEAEANNENAKTVIRHIQQWSDGIYEGEKELLLAAIEKRSHFTFDMFHWIAHITKLLLAVSNAPACSDHTRDELRRNALWLISVLSWVPDDKEVVAFLENFQMTETLFDAAIDAHNRECSEVSEQVRDLLLAWAFKAGKYETGWAILERACYGLATLDVMRGLDRSVLLRVIAERLAKEGAPNQAIRDRTAREIRERAATLYRNRHTYSRIEYVMGKSDESTMRPFLEEIANLLSPGTANDPVRPDVF